MQEKINNTSCFVKFVRDILADITITMIALKK